jgi:hypothetical protein
VCSGAGLGLAVQISASAEGVSAYTEALSYDSPLTTWVSSRNIALRSVKMIGMSGELPFTSTQGISFGVSSYSAASRSMFTAAVATEWSSDSGLAIRPSLGFNSRFAPCSVTVQLAKGTRHMKLFTFDSPSVIVAAHRQSIFAVALPPRPNFPTTGHPIVTVLGTNFGLANSSPMTRMGSPSSWTIWQVDTSLVCRAPPGVGQMFGVGVTVAAYSGTLTSCCSYNTPTLSTLDQFNAPSDHEAGIFIMGNNFGSEVYSELTRAGGTGSISTEWMSNTQVAAKLANGVGQRHSVVATVSEQVGTLQAILSFDSHSLGNVDRGTEVVAYNIATSEDRWILVSGNGFGTADWSMCVRVGSTAAESSVWNSESQVQSQYAPGVNSGLALVVTFAKKSVTRERMLSYDMAKISSVYATNAPSQGSNTIQIFGTAFGTSDLSGAARLGKTACMLSRWSSDSCLICKVPSGSSFEQATLKLTLWASDG